MVSAEAPGEDTGAAGVGAGGGGGLTGGGGGSVASSMRTTMAEMLSRPPASLARRISVVVASEGSVRLSRVSLSWGSVTMPVRPSLQSKKMSPHSNFSESTSKVTVGSMPTARVTMFLGRCDRSSSDISGLRARMSLTRVWSRVKSSSFLPRIR